MRTPSFRYMGGKSRLRKWLIAHFPKSGRHYIEPFAGLGNVYYQSRKDLSFEQWSLGDINGFLGALARVDLDLLPTAVSREEFEVWKTSGCDVSKVIEPKVTFAGKGYKSGFDGGHPSHPPYNGRLHRAICEEAKALLETTQIRQCNWFDWNYDELTESDFVYLDPPYYGTKASYPNIDHEQLVELLNGAEFRWALSGYNNELYSTQLRYANRLEKIRNSEIKSSNTGKYSGVCEVLWTNFS